MSVENGVVTLEGTVGNRSEKRRAELLLDEIRGISDITNRIRVAGGTAP